MLWWWKWRATSADSRTRLAAIRKLAASGNPAAAETLLGALRDDSDDVAAAAIEGLAGLKDPRAAKTLLLLLNVPGGTRAYLAAAGLARLGDKGAVPGLLGRLKGGMGSRVSTTLDAIDPGWPTSDEARKAVPELARALADGQADSADTVEKALDRIDPGWRESEAGREAASRVVPKLGDEAFHVRASAAEMLERVGGRGSVEALVRALGDEMAPVRKAAVAALGRIGDPRAVEPLRDLLLAAGGEAGLEALRALKTLGWTPGSARERVACAIHAGRWDEAAAEKSAAVDPLLGMLKSEDKGSRSGAAGALGKIGDRRALEPLLPLLADRVLGVRVQAMAAVHKIDPEWPKSEEARRAIPALAEGIHVNDVDAQLAAIEALAKIGGPAIVDPLRHAAEKADCEAVRSAARAALAPAEPAPAAAAEVPKGPVKCSACGREMDPRTVEAGPQARVALILEGTALPLRCTACGDVVCGECMTGAAEDLEGGARAKHISIECRKCGGRLEIMAGRGPSAEDEAPARFNEAVDLANGGRVREAIQLLGKAIQCRPDWHLPYYVRGRLRSTLGDRHGMVADFKKADEHAPPGWEGRDEIRPYVDPTRRGRPSGFA